MAPHSSCVVNVTFTPKSIASYDYPLQLSDGVTYLDRPTYGPNTEILIPLIGSGT